MTQLMEVGQLMSESTIGDYYDRVAARRQKAIERLDELTKRYERDSTYENYRAMWEAQEAVIDAGNTGD